VGKGSITGNGVGIIFKWNKEGRKSIIPARSAIWIRKVLAYVSPGCRNFAKLPVVHVTVTGREILMQNCIKLNRQSIFISIQA
jgi:hypothetical protein